MEAIILGAVQGLTEFLPVSSSGHLVIFEHVMGVRTPGAVFEVAVHVGTLAAIFIFFRREIFAIIKDVLLAMRRPARPQVLFARLPHCRTAALIIAGTIPTAVIGGFFKGTFEAMFDNLLLVGVALAITAAFVGVTVRARRRAKENGGVSFLDAVVIGADQGAAITPGISRSGATISAALLRGVAPKQAAAFSFLLGIPAMLAAAVIELPKLGGEVMPWSTVGAAVVTSAVVGYFSLKLVIRLVGGGKFHFFAVYCGLAAAFTIGWAVMG